MADKEKLLKARDAINAKDYKTARWILEGLPHNSTAQAWLAKLDEIAPIHNPSQRQNSSIPTAKTQLNDPPINPRHIGGRYSYFTPLGFYSLANNWTRLGKPEWKLNTLAIGSLLFFLIIFPFIELIFPLQSPTMATYYTAFFLSSMITGIVGTVLFVQLLKQLQKPAYDKFARGDVNGMFSHHYPTTAYGVTFATILLIIGGGLATAILIASQPISYDTPYLTFSADKRMEDQTTTVAQNWCNPNDPNCELILALEPPSGLPSFFVTLITEFTDTEYERDLTVDYLTSTDFSDTLYRLEGIGEITIDGFVGHYADFWFSHPENDTPIYLRYIYIFDGNIMIEFYFDVLELEYFEDNFGTYKQIVQTIDFKANGLR